MDIRDISIFSEVPIVTISSLPDERYRLTYHATKEVMESDKGDDLLRELARDHGYYLRPIPKRERKDK